MIELLGNVIVPFASKFVKYPAALVEPPIVTPFKVVVVIDPYQVDVAREPVKRLAERLVNVPAAAVLPPMVTPFKVVVEMERPVAVPAALIFHVLESMITASPLSPIFTAPLNVAVLSTNNVLDVPNPPEEFIHARVSSISVPPYHSVKLLVCPKIPLMNSWASSVSPFIVNFPRLPVPPIVTLSPAVERYTSAPPSVQALEPAAEIQFPPISLKHPPLNCMPFAKVDEAVFEVIFRAVV